MKENELTPSNEKTMEKYHHDSFDVRKKWIMAVNPSATEIVTRFPRLLDMRVAVIIHEPSYLSEIYIFENLFRAVRP